MAWNVIIGAIAGTVAGATYGGITSYKNAMKNAQEYQKYADTLSKAADKYSGKEANDAMAQSGSEMARVSNALSQNAAANANTGNTNSIMANALNKQRNVAANNSFNQGYNTGSRNKATTINAQYNKDTAAAQNMLNQAGINYKRDTAMQQAGLNTAGNAISAYNNIMSDERAKEYNNKAGLPKADVDDALRQIESIEYKYKPETGLDSDKHVGVTAQSLEGTAFDNVVSTDQKSGYKQLDKQKLLESVMAGIASMRKELDELENK